MLYTNTPKSYFFSFTRFFSLFYIGIIGSAVMLTFGTYFDLEGSSLVFVMMHHYYYYSEMVYRNHYNSDLEVDEYYFLEEDAFWKEPTRLDQFENLKVFRVFPETFMFWRSTTSFGWGTVNLPIYIVIVMLGLFNLSNDIIFNGFISPVSSTEMDDLILGELDYFEYIIMWLFALEFMFEGGFGNMPTESNAEKDWIDFDEDRDFESMRLAGNEHYKKMFYSSK